MQVFFLSAVIELHQVFKRHFTPARERTGHNVGFVVTVLKRF
jgi:hypothetical protein